MKDLKKIIEKFNKSTPDTKGTKAVEWYGDFIVKLTGNDIELLLKILQSQQPEVEQPSAEEYFAQRNGGKTALQMTADKEYISATWATILMHEYAQSKQIVMPGDKEIEKQFPISSSHQMDTDSWNNRLRQDGAKWFMQRIKELNNLK